MPLTTLDPNPALVLVDLQNGIAALPLAHPAADIIARAAQLARAFRRQGFPVVLVNVLTSAPGRNDTGPRSFNFTGDLTAIVSELDQQPTDLVITKRAPGAFINTPLHDLLQERGVTQVFLAGIATGTGVEATARSAYDYGYNIVFAADAMTDRSVEAHQYPIESTFPRLGEVDTTANLLTRLTHNP